MKDLKLTGQITIPFTISVPGDALTPADVRRIKKQFREAFDWSAVVTVKDWLQEAADGTPTVKQATIEVEPSR